MTAHQPVVRAALAALATLPDDWLMGWERRPDGSPGADLTVADIRRGLLDGTGVDPEKVPSSVALMRRIRSRANQY